MFSQILQHSGVAVQCSVTLMHTQALHLPAASHQQWCRDAHHQGPFLPALCEWCGHCGANLPSTEAGPSRTAAYHGRLAREDTCLWWGAVPASSPVGSFTGVSFWCVYKDEWFSIMCAIDATLCVCAIVLWSVPLTIHCVYMHVYMCVNNVIALEWWFAKVRSKSCKQRLCWHSCQCKKEYLYLTVVRGPLSRVVVSLRYLHIHTLAAPTFSENLIHCTRIFMLHTCTTQTMQCTQPIGIAGLEYLPCAN